MMTGNENGVMRKAGVLAVVLLAGMLAVGCSKDVMLHSEEEMRQFALSSLDEKYSESFVIDESFYRYKHKNGHEDIPIILNVRIRPESDDNLCAAFYLTEYGSIIDNYSIIRHQYEVEDENDHDYIFYQLNKDDGRSSADEWQDEEILRISEVMIRDSERDLIRDGKSD